MAKQYIETQEHPVIDHVRYFVDYDEHAEHPFSTCDEPGVLQVLKSSHFREQSGMEIISGEFPAVAKNQFAFEISYQGENARFVLDREEGVKEWGRNWRKGAAKYYEATAKCWEHFERYGGYYLGVEVDGEVKDNVGGFVGYDSDDLIKESPDYFGGLDSYAKDYIKSICPTCFSWSPRLLASLMVGYEAAIKTPLVVVGRLEEDSPQKTDFLFVLNQVAKKDFAQMPPDYKPPTNWLRWEVDGNEGQTELFTAQIATQ